MKTKLFKICRAVLDHILGSIAYVLYYLFFYAATLIDWIIRKIKGKHLKKLPEWIENYW